MQVISNYLTYLPKRFSALIALVLIAIVPAVVMAGWGPERQTFTHDAPADYVTFNSIVDNPEYGDERAFFDVKKFASGDDPSNVDPGFATSGGYQNEMQVEDGDVVMFRAYIHNNASVHLNTDGSGIARNTQFRALVPNGQATIMRSIGYVSADNAQPSIVSDTADLYADEPFSLDFLPGSATFYTNSVPTGMQLPDSVVSSGAQLGQSSLDGNFPGCFESAGILTYFVRVNMGENEVDKKVRLEGQTSADWVEELTAQPGDTVEYRLEYDNQTPRTTNNVILGDNLPDGMTFVDDSTRLYSANYNGAVDRSDNIVNGGLGVGSFTSNSNIVAVIQAEVPERHELECGNNRFVNQFVVRVNDAAYYTDTATVNVKKTCEEPKPQTLVCSTLAANPLTLMEGGTVNFNASANATNGASITDYTYNYGDGNSETTGNSASHTYANAGNYTARVNVNGVVDGDNVSRTSNACKVHITVEEEPETPVYACDALAASPSILTVGEQVNFTVSGSASGGATITGYTLNAGDGSAEQSANTSAGNAQFSHTYNTPGNYTATAEVVVNVDGQSSTASGQNCRVYITVEEEPEEPVYSCDALAVVLRGENTYQLAATASASNGAVISSYDFDYGDGTTQTVTTSNGMATADEHTYTTPGTYNPTVTVNFTVDGQTVSSSNSACTGTVVVEEEPVDPVYECTALTASRSSLMVNEEVTYTATANAANGAEIVSYSFNLGDGTVETVDTTDATASVTHTYATAGTYVAAVAVTFNVDGETQVVTDKDCAVMVEVEEEPVDPIYVCDAIEATHILGGLKVEVKVTATASNGASINKVSFDYGDGNTFDTNNLVGDGDTKTVTVEHEYAEAGEYTISATITFDVDDTQKTVVCSTSVNVEEEPEVCEYDETLPKDDPDCKEDETPEDPKDPETPTVLPNTGAGAALMGIFGTSAVGTMLRGWMISRRNLRSSLIGE